MTPPPAYLDEAVSHNAYICRVRRTWSVSIRLSLLRPCPVHSVIPLPLFSCCWASHSHCISSSAAELSLEDSAAGILSGVIFAPGCSHTYWLLSISPSLGLLSVACGLALLPQQPLPAFLDVCPELLIGWVPCHLVVDSQCNFLAESTTADWWLGFIPWAPGFRLQGGLLWWYPWYL